MAVTGGYRFWLGWVGRQFELFVVALEIAMRRVDG